jgi:hypothetical protein
MLSSSSKEMILHSICVTIMPKRVHKKSMYQTQMADLICTTRLKKKSHIENKVGDLTCQSTQCLQGNLDTQQLAQNVSNSNEMILIFKHYNP